MNASRSKKKRMSRLRLSMLLFLTFLKIGAITFGGGYAMIPLISEETVVKKHWISDRELLDIVAVAESTPGPVAVNAATYVGYRTAGIFGAVAATLGVVLPSFVIISTVSSVLREFGDIKPVQYAFIGIRAGVLALIVRALYTMYRECPKDPVMYILAGTVFVMAAFLHINVLFLILLSAVVGLIVMLCRERQVKTK